jgi:hypothetical protein
MGDSATTARERVRALNDRLRQHGIGGTTLVTPGHMNSRTVSSSVRPSRLPPDTFSDRTISQPSAFSLTRWVSRSWSAVLTRA